MSPISHRLRRMLRRPLLVSALLPAAACFGTGVSVGDPSMLANGQRALLLSDVALAPPAPVVQAVPWTNGSTSALTITHIDVADGAKTTFDGPDCPGYPRLAPQSSCPVRFIAHTDATPGTYPVVVSYEVEGKSAQASFTLTVVPGSLRINDGAPVALDARSTAVPVMVTNDGFDLASLNLDVQCPPSSSAGSSCTLDPNDCNRGLRANASCTARLITTEPAAGQLGSVTAGGADTGAVSCSVAISVGSLVIQNMAVSAPGVHSVVLTNLGSSPLSVTDVAVTAPTQAGIAVTGAARTFAACQNFVGTCSVPLTVGADAVLTDGLGVIAVTYDDGLARHRATGVLTLDNATTVQVQTGVVLNSAAANQTVAATNLGPWVWHGAGLSFTAPWPGVTLSSTCATDIAVGEAYTATATTTYSTAEGSASGLQALGHNLKAPASAPIAIGRSMVATGTDGANGGFLATSTDEGRSWQVAQPAPANTTWHASLLGATSWAVVGTAQGAPAAAYSVDRGAFWQAAALPGSIMGSLNALAAHGSVMATFGDDGMGSVLMFVSTDAGRTWVTTGTNLGAQAVGAIYGAASNGTAWVVVGGDGSQYFMASSTDDGATWAGAPPATGTLYAVAWDGAHWVAVGDNGAGNILIVSNDSAAAAVPNWSVVTTSGAGSLRGIAYNGNSWLAVGGNGAQRIFAPSIDATLPSFAAPRTIAPGNYMGLAAHGTDWVAAGYDSTLSAPVIDRSPDGVALTSSPQGQAAGLTGVFSR